MILTFFAMTGATAAAAALSWRLLIIVKREGVAWLLSMQNAGGTVLHVCLLFTWILFIREGMAVLFDAAPLKSMVGFGAMFCGILAMCLAGTKKQFSAAEPAKTKRK